MQSNPSTLSRAYGIVQGRLSIPPQNSLQWFPQPCWEKEFITAHDVGLNFIELLVEREFNPDNPFWSIEGRKKIKELCIKYDLSIYSSCLDYIINHSLTDSTNDVRKYMIDFIAASADLGCQVIVLPLLEESDLNLSSSQTIGPILIEYSQVAKAYGLTICIESLMESSDLKTFISSLNVPNIKCVFDTGNRALITKSLKSEIIDLGHLIGHVHIKDKQESGENVLLGRGKVDFLGVFEALHEINYNGPMVFETTRGINPTETVKYHITTCSFYDKEAKLA